MALTISNQRVIRSFLHLLPEMDSIHALLDTKCYALHRDDNFHRFPDFFRKIIQENIALFTCKDVKSRANILFDNYRDIVVGEVEKEPNFSSFCAGIFTQLRDASATIKDETVLREIQALSRLRMKLLHTSLIQFAIADTLKINRHAISLSEFPDNYQKRELKIPNVALSKLLCTGQRIV